MGGVEEWKRPIETGPIPESGDVFDVIVVGGGPGGSAAASYHAMAGSRVLLLEKEVWPRDKICGDAVGGKSLSHVAELGVKSMIEETPHYRVDSIVFSSSDGSEVRVMLPEEEFERMEAGYALPRLQFDYMMFKQATELVIGAGGAVIQEFSVKDVVVDDGVEGSAVTGITGFIGHRKDGVLCSYSSALTIGAAGYNCPVARAITESVYEEPFRDAEHFCGGYREYWTGVEGCDGDSGPIEIHFIDEVNPGYFWIFPVNENVVNVGVGMVISEQRKQEGMRSSLKKMQKWITDESDRFSHRFKKAQMVEGSGRGWQLPFGSPRKNPASFQPRRSAMAGAMCVGDSASLVDPFTGEGIGNALLSAKLTTQFFDPKKHSSGFPADQATAYMEALWGELGNELSNSYRLQGMVKRKRLMSWFVRRASKKPKIGEILTEMIASKESQENLYSKWFLFKTIVLP